MKTPEELVKNDLFYIRFGFEVCKFRVSHITDTHVFAHKLNWCKRDAHPFPLNQFKEREYFYYKKMSKFRAFFLI